MVCANIKLLPLQICLKLIRTCKKAILSVWPLEKNICLQWEIYSIQKHATNSVLTESYILESYLNCFAVTHCTLYPLSRCITQWAVERWQEYHNRDLPHMSVRSVYFFDRYFWRGDNHSETHAFIKENCNLTQCIYKNFCTARSLLCNTIQWLFLLRVRICLKNTWTDSKFITEVYVCWQKVLHLWKF